MPKIKPTKTQQEEWEVELWNNLAPLDHPFGRGFREKVINEHLEKVRALLTKTTTEAREKAIEECERLFNEVLKEAGYPSLLPKHIRDFLKKDLKRRRLNQLKEKK